MLQRVLGDLGGAGRKCLVFPHLVAPPVGADGGVTAQHEHTDFEKKGKMVTVAISISSVALNTLVCGCAAATPALAFDAAVPHAGGSLAASSIQPSAVVSVSGTDKRYVVDRFFLTIAQPGPPSWVKTVRKSQGLGNATPVRLLLRIK